MIESEREMKRMSGKSDNNDKIEQHENSLSHFVIWINCIEFVIGEPFIMGIPQY